MKNNNILQLNREERRRQKKDAKKEIIPTRLEMIECDVTSEDYGVKSAFILHFDKCSYQKGLCIIDILNAFVKKNPHVLLGGLKEIKKNNKCIEFFDFLLVNINEIDNVVFKKMVMDTIMITLDFTFEGVELEGEC